MRILQLSPQFPFPENDGGKISISNTLRFASKDHELTMICLDNGFAEEDQIKIAKEYGEIHIVKADLKNHPINILKSVLSDQSIYLMKHSFPETIDAIEQIVKDKEFDCIHVDHTAMAPVAFYLKQKYKWKIGLRLHNIENVIWHRYADKFSAINPKKWYLKRQASHLERMEAKYIKEADYNFVMTPKEKERALKMAPGANVFVFPAGVDPEKLRRDSLNRNPYRMIIATNYNWVHNVDGLRWFIEKVLPIVKSEIPEAELYLLGKDIPDSLKGYESKGVKVIGFVDSIVPYLSESSVYVAPLFVGSGIRIKILEALSFELPVVATSVSAEGIEINENNGLFVNDDEKSQAKQIIDLMRDPEKVKELGEKARSSVSENYNWEKNILKMMASYES